MNTENTPSENGKAAGGIGTENESSLHRSLKAWYAGEKGETEVLAGGFICDVRAENGELIEIQTGSFFPLKEKVKALSKTARVRIVHPVAVHRSFDLYSAEGDLVRQGKTPGKKGIWDLFTALTYAPELPLLPNVTIEIALIDVLERRIDDGKGSWWRKGIRVADRTLAGWRESVVLSRPADYYRFVPFTKDENFTVKALAVKAGTNKVVARRCLYVLSKMGIVKREGKDGHAYLYHLLPPAAHQ
jgi:hypothetical protein